MSILSVDEIEDERESTIGQYWKRTYKLAFRVITTDPLDGAWLVRSSIPYGIGSFYSTTTEHDYGAFAQEIRAKQEKTGDGKSWIVTVDFGPYDANKYPSDPTLWVPDVDWDWAQFEEIADKDINGEDVVNSAGLPFDPPLKKDMSRPILKIVRNELNFDQALADSYRDSINQDAFWGFDPKTVKVSCIKGKRVYNPDIGYYWQVSYEFHINKKKWDPEVLDAGYYQIDTSTNKLKAITKNGVPVSVPVPLDGNGQPLDINATPNYITFEILNPMDFSIFNLDTLYQEVTNPTPPSGTGGGSGPG